MPLAREVLPTLREAVVLMRVTITPDLRVRLHTDIDVHEVAWAVKEVDEARDLVASGEDPWALSRDWANRAQAVLDDAAIIHVTDPRALAAALTDAARQVDAERDRRESAPAIPSSRWD